MFNEEGKEFHMMKSLIIVVNSCEINSKEGGLN